MLSAVFVRERGIADALRTLLGLLGEFQNIVNMAFLGSLPILKCNFDSGSILWFLFFKEILEYLSSWHIIVSGYSVCLPNGRTQRLSRW